MRLYAQLATVGIIAVGGLMSIGCTVHTHEPDVVYSEPAAGYVYYDNDYYRRGRWDGDYWAWRDRDGHFYRERRDIHERHMTERPHEEHEREHEHDRH